MYLHSFIKKIVVNVSPLDENKTKDNGFLTIFLCIILIQFYSFIINTFTALGAVIKLNNYIEIKYHCVS